VEEHPDRVIADLGEVQHGRVARRQLLDSGLSKDQIQSRLDSGHLHRVTRGVYAVGHPGTSLRAAQMAAVLAAGREAVLSHTSAAALWGLLAPEPPPFHVTRPGSTLRRRGVPGHRAKLPTADVTVYDRIPVTTVARTIIDLAESEGEPILLRALGEAEVRGLITRQALVDALPRWNGRRGLKPLRVVLLEDLGAAPTRSHLEDLFHRLVREAGLPRPISNTTVLGYEVDAFWPQHRVVVELDGRTFHDTATRFEFDRARDARLVAAGYVPLRFTWRRLKRESLRVVTELSAVLAVAGREAGGSTRG
jgi:very-short-patch-repair endonuclease